MAAKESRLFSSRKHEIRGHQGAPCKGRREIADLAQRYRIDTQSPRGRFGW